MTGAVHPELVPFLAMLPRFALSDAELAGQRRFFDEMFGAAALAPPEGDGVRRDRRRIMSAEGRQIELWIYRPEAPASEARPAILHFHAGGLVLGSPAWSDASNRRFARELGAVVVSVDYRLAPEHRFPVPLEDAHTALLWLHREAPGLGVDRGRICVAGESAGGCLAAALALKVRDEGGPPLAFQFLVYPMLDDRTGLEGDAAEHHVWTRANNRYSWRAYLTQAPGSESVPLLAAPARARDLSGLPPAFIAVGSLDLFAEENAAYAARLRGAGVPVELAVYEGAFHGFDALPSSLGSRFASESLEALKRATTLRR